VKIREFVRKASPGEGREEVPLFADDGGVHKSFLRRNVQAERDHQRSLQLKRNKGRPVLTRTEILLKKVGHRGLNIADRIRRA